MTSIAHSVTTTVTNPYARIEIPAIGRVLQALWDMAARLSQRTIQISIRQLADAAGLSAGGIGKYLRQLEADGYISYDPASSLVMITAEIDHGTDRSSQEIGSETPTAETSDHTGDRVKTPCMDHESYESKREESCTPHFENSHQEALYHEAMSYPGVKEPGAYIFATTGYQGTIEEFRVDIDRAQRTPWSHSPVFLAMRRWIDGERVSEPAKESDNVRSHRPERTERSDRQRRSRTGSASGAGQAGSRNTSQRRAASPGRPDRFARFAKYLDTDGDTAGGDTAHAA